MKNDFWLLYGNGVDSTSVFENFQNDPDHAAGLGCRLVEELEKAGFNVKLTNDALGIDKNCAGFLSWDVNPQILRNIGHLDRNKCYLLVYEPPYICPQHYSDETKKYFGSIFVLFDDLVDNENYFKIQLPSPAWYYARVPKDLPDFSEKKLCAMMNTNKSYEKIPVEAWPNELYSARRSAVEFFTKTGEFDLYGRGWYGISSWKGFAPDGHLLKNYKFTICYENLGNRPGYMGGKIFSVLTSRSVPIYLGATNIQDYVPQNCFIDLRNFSSYQNLYEFMKKMDKKTHEAYLAAGLSYLQSSKKDLFTVDYVVNLLIKKILNSI